MAVSRWRIVSQDRPHAAVVKGEQVEAAAGTFGGGRQAPTGYAQWHALSYRLLFQACSAASFEMDGQLYVRTPALL